MKKLIDKIYHNRIFSWLFPTTVFCLRKNLRDCESVLDLGCGPSSPLQYCENVSYSVGVETFKPYLDESKKRKIHTEYIEKRVEEVAFPQKRFDAVIMIEVLEHLPEKNGYAMLEKAEKWAKKKVIVSTPNGFLPQNSYDGNPFQKHLSGWSIETMKRRGFRCRGLSGFKWIRQEAPLEGVGDDFMASIRLRPRFFWFIIATLSQLITYFYPKYAFELFCVHPVKSSLREVSVSSGEFNRVKK
ncbi:MAG: methyltransferase domain-containing protein [Patescibacteria group bacterium]|nr:methyltransferase domain-containing protein [Patescibacteria group bacterium]